MGKGSNSHEKAKAIKFANDLKVDRRNTPKVIIVSLEDSTQANLFWEKIEGGESDVAEAQDDDEVAENTGDIALHRLNKDGRVLSSFEKPFKRANLTAEGLYALQLPNQLMLWVGKEFGKNNADADLQKIGDAVIKGTNNASKTRVDI